MIALLARIPLPFAEPGVRPAERVTCFHSRASEAQRAIKSGVTARAHIPHGPSGGIAR